MKNLLIDLSEYYTLDNYSEWPKKHGVYVIITESEETKKYYVGMTAKSFKERWMNHVSRLQKGTHHNHSLQKAFDSKELFKFITLENIELKQTTLHFLRTREKKNWDKLNNLGLTLHNKKPGYRGILDYDPLTEEQKELALKLYFQENYSQEKIALELNTIYHRINDYFKEIDAVKKKQELGYNKMGYRTLTREEKAFIKGEFCEKGSSIKHIAKSLKSKYPRVRDYIIKNDLDSLRIKNGLPSGHLRKTSNTSKEEIIKLYKECGSLTEVSNHLKIHYYDVRKVIISENLIRKLSISKDELESLYIGENRTAKEIAHIFNVSEKTVKNRLRSLNIRKIK